MIPDAVERQIGLAHVESHLLVAKHVQVQRAPVCWTVFDEHESFEGKRNAGRVYGGWLSHRFITCQIAIGYKPTATNNQARKAGLQQLAVDF
jgi:hypothetical protein